MLSKKEIQISNIDEEIAKSNLRMNILKRKAVEFLVETLTISFLHNESLGSMIKSIRDFWSRDPCEPP